MTVLQTNLHGEAIQPTSKQTPRKSLGCCEACYNATGKRCECKCRGAFHGLGNSKVIARNEKEEINV